MRDIEVCENCIHCHKAKELVDAEWKEYYVCTLWLDTGEKQEPLLLTLGSHINRPNCDLCECFNARRELNESKAD